MENYTYNSQLLQLEGLMVMGDSVYPVFFFFLLSYVLVIILNMGILVLIVVDKNLHQPMYMLFCSLPLSDMMGSTHLIPRLLSDLLKPPAQRLIWYHECALQAFITQYFGTTSHTILMIMAFDRYVAICNPLHYSSVMTNKMIIKLTVAAWAVPMVLTGILISLSVRLSRCRTMIVNIYCDNASLFKLSCENTVVNNVYGLTFTVVLYIASIGCMVLTYARIAMVCVTCKNQSMNRKAIKTCSTHLVVYLVMACSGFTIIILHRFPQYSEYRKYFMVLFAVVPVTLNPVIYGLQSKEIRKFLFELFKSKKCFPRKKNKQKNQHLGENNYNKSVKT